MPLHPTDDTYFIETEVQADYPFQANQISNLVKAGWKILAVSYLPLNGDFTQTYRISMTRCSPASKITKETLDNLSDAEKVSAFKWAMEQDFTKEPIAAIPVESIPLRDRSTEGLTEGEIKEHYGEECRYYECKVCGRLPVDDAGGVEHGRGCYTQDIEGGGYEILDENQVT